MRVLHRLLAMLRPLFEPKGRGAAPADPGARKNEGKRPQPRAKSPKDESAPDTIYPMW
jgi:hypothetical protein